MTIGGNSHVTDALLIEGTHRSQFEHLNLRDATEACFHSEFAVTDTYKNLACSTQSSTFTTIPTYGFIFDAIGGSQTTNGTVTDIRAEGVGTGIYLKSASTMTFTSGTSENNSGMGVQINSASFTNTFIDFDMELNAGGTDVQDAGTGTHWINPIAVDTTGINIVAPGAKQESLEGKYLPTG